MKKNKIYNLFLSSLFFLSVPAISFLLEGKKNNQLNDVSNNNLIDQHIKKGYQFDEGEAAAVATDQDGYDHLYMWGDNSHNQLGLNYLNPYFNDELNNQNLATKNYYYTPRELPITKDNKGNIDDVQSTKLNTIVSFSDQDANYELYIYGANKNGLLTEDQLYLNSIEPFVLEIPSNLEIKDMALTDDNVYLLLNESGGKKQYLYSWGLNDYGQLGFGFKDNYIHKTPRVSKYVNGLSSDDYNIESIYAQNDALYLVVDNNEYQTIYSLGSDKYGQLGNGVNETDTGYILIPTEISFFNQIKPQQILLDGNNNNDIYVQYQKDQDTYLVGWGNNIQKRLVNIDQRIINQPTAIFGNQVGKAGDPIYNKDQKNLLFSDFGYEQSFLVYQADNQYQLYGWGINNHYSLGLGNDTQYNEQTLIKSALITDYTDYTIEGISTGRHSTDLMVKNSNDDEILYTWGYNQTGQLGNGEEASFAAQANTTVYIPLQTYFENDDNVFSYIIPLVIFIVVIVILIFVLISLYISVKRYKILALPPLKETESNIEKALVNELAGQELAQELVPQELVGELAKQDVASELKEQELESELTPKNIDLNSD